MARRGAAKEWRVEIPVAASALARNRQAAALGIRATQDYQLTGIERWGEMLAPDTPIQADDVLVFAATEARCRGAVAAARCSAAVRSACSG